MAGGGGAWKVAYADFVTAMMAFFMVMWLLSQNEKVKKAVALHFRNPYGQFAMGDSLMAPKQDQYFKDRPHVVPQGKSGPPPELEGPKTRQAYSLSLNQGDRTILGTVVTFLGNSTELDDAAKSHLKDFVPLIDGKPQKIEIRGHALRRSPNSSETLDPYQLSYQRCISTMEYLVDLGIQRERIRLSQAGAYEPYTLGDDPTQTARNSRIDVYLLNEVAEDALGTREERDQRYKAPQ